jgi:predicted RNase H-like HicB family nuclease
MPNPHTDVVAEPVRRPAPAPFSLKVKVDIEALVIPEATGGYSVIVPALPGCCTQGDTLDEVKSNVVEATELWLECAHEEHAAQALKNATE